MLLRLCPGFPAYKSLDQTQHGIKLTTVQLNTVHTCGAGTQLAGKQVGLIHVAFNSTAIESKVDKLKHHQRGESMTFSTFIVRPCEVGLIPVFSLVAVWVVGEITERGLG